MSIGFISRELTAPDTAAADTFATYDALVEGFGGAEAVENLPLLPTEAVRVGSSGYLDQTTAEDIHGEPITRGVDPYGRRFFTFYVRKKPPHEEGADIVTLFQRYIDNQTRWALAGAFSHRVFPSPPIPLEERAGFYADMIHRLVTRNHENVELVDSSA